MGFIAGIRDVTCSFFTFLPFPDTVTTWVGSFQLTCTPTIFKGAVTAPTDARTRPRSGPKRREATTLRRLAHWLHRSLSGSSLKDFSHSFSGVEAGSPFVWNTKMSNIYFPVENQESSKKCIITSTNMSRMDWSKNSSMRVLVML